MKVKTFNDFWKEEMVYFGKAFYDRPELLVEFMQLAKRSWEQAIYTSNNAPR